MDETTARRPCPYCAEDIAVTAVRCPHCRSRFATFDPAAWRRDHPERLAAGVAAAIAHATALPAAAVRLGFVALTFLHLMGPLLYAIGWLVIPPAAGSPSIVERFLVQALSALRRWRGDGPTPPATFRGGRAA